MLYIKHIYIYILKHELVWTHKGKKLLGRLDAYGTIILKRIVPIELEEVEWIQLAHYCDKWGFLVNKILKFGLCKILGISWLAEERLASQEGRCFV
jgi:hypothetical protein